MDTGFLSRVWGDRPERQRFFEGDKVTVVLRNERCRIERVHPPEEYTSVVGPRMHGWRYTVRPLYGPQPHAYLVNQTQLSDV